MTTTMLMTSLTLDIFCLVSSFWKIVIILFIDYNIIRLYFYICMFTSVSGRHIPSYPPYFSPTSPSFLSVYKFTNNGPD